jgi:hypothetical protein
VVKISTSVPLTTSGEWVGNPGITRIPSPTIPCWAIGKKGQSHVGIEITFLLVHISKASQEIIRNRVLCFDTVLDFLCVTTQNRDAKGVFEGDF